MFAKLFITILALGCIAAVLLVLRQQRIDLAHEMAESHQRLVEQETEVWRLRAEVVSRCRPEDIRRAVEQSDQTWTDIPQRPAPTEPTASSVAGGNDSNAIRQQLAGG